MNKVIELDITSYRESIDALHINDNIDWCINRGVHSLNFMHINPYVDYSFHISNLGEVVTINTGRLV
jgi:hypothetical protein